MEYAVVWRSPHQFLSSEYTQDCRKMSNRDCHYLFCHCAVRHNHNVYRRSIYLRGDQTSSSCNLHHWCIYTKWYGAFLCKHMLPLLSQHQCVDRTIFIQDCSPPYIAIPVKQRLSANFGDKRFRGHHFPTMWPPSSADFNPWDFLL